MKTIKPLLVAISTGHHPRRPGTTEGQYTEHSEMAPIVGLLVQTLIYAGHYPYIIQAGPLGSKIKAVNALNADCAIELHLNAGGGTGCETLYCPGSEGGKVLALEVNNSIINGFGSLLNLSVRNRGVKPGWHKMIVGGDKDAFLEKTNCPATITEMYFMDNKDEFELFSGNIDFYKAMSISVASGLISWHKKIKGGSSSD